jgi:hypothetical protein
MSAQSTIRHHLTRLEDRAGLSFEELHQIDDMIDTSDMMQRSIKLSRELNDTKAGAMYLAINVAKSLIPSERPLNQRWAGIKLLRTIMMDLKKGASRDSVANGKLKAEISQVRSDIIDNIRRA